MKSKIEFCVPPFFRFHSLEYDFLREKTGKTFQYASRGRYSIYHIIHSLEIKKGVLLPAYFCETILEVLTSLKIPFQFYDLDLEDLNPDIFSIERELQLTGYDGVLVPSLYGNSADLPQIELLCQKYGAKMIDDAAQSFGAVGSDGRLVGTYGAAGLLAFSPGKSTMAHMGSLYWTSNEKYNYPHTRHSVYHFLCYINFLLNRQLVYFTRYVPFFWIFGLYHKLLKEQMLVNDSITGFEEKILGGVLKALFDGKFQVYEFYWDYFDRTLKNTKNYRVIRNIHGRKSVPRKIILLFYDKAECDKMKNYLYKKKIAFFPGYKLLPGDYSGIPNTMKIVDHIIELPIEDNKKRMQYMVDMINNYN